MKKKQKKLNGCWLAMYERYKFNSLDNQDLTDVQARFNVLLYDWFLNKQGYNSVPSSAMVENNAVNLMEQANKESEMDGIDPDAIRASFIDGAIRNLTLLTVKEIVENQENGEKAPFLKVHAVISTSRLTKMEICCLESCFNVEENDDLDALSVFLISVPLCGAFTEEKKEKVQDFCVRKMRSLLQIFLVENHRVETGFKYRLVHKILDFFIKNQI
ncbi:hypothetical protein D3C87_378370 [compost metagenome]